MRIECQERLSFVQQISLFVFTLTHSIEINRVCNKSDFLPDLMKDNIIQGRIGSPFNGILSIQTTVIALM